MINSEHTVTIGVYPPGITADTGTVSNAPFGVNDDKVGADAKMTIQTNSVEHTRADGSKETVSSVVQATHDSAHGAAIVSGTQAPERKFLNPTGKEYITQPAEKDAVKAEDAARKFEKMLPRDN